MHTKTASPSLIPHLLEGFIVIMLFLMAITEAVEITTSPHNTSLIAIIMTSSAMLCCIEVGVLHINFNPYEPLEAVQKSINFFLLFVALNVMLLLKIKAPLFLVPAVVMLLIGIWHYKFHRAIGIFCFLCVGFIAEISWEKWGQKMIRKESFWLVILLILCIIGKSTSNEKIYLLMTALPLSIIWLLEWLDGSAIFALGKICLFSMLLVIAMPVYPYYIGITMLFGISTLLAFILLAVNDYIICN